MPVEVADLTTLDPALVAEALAEVTQRLQEANPTLDLKRGVLHDLLAYYHAALATGHRVALDRYLSARSLLDVAADPTLADPGVVDGILSNWGLARGEGAPARGEVTVVVSSGNSVTIAAGAVFAADGRAFASDAAFTAKPEAEQINDPSDRLLTRLADGAWAFTVDVTAAEPGVASLVRKDTLLVPESPPLGYVTSYAASDFAGGLDAENNDELLRRLQEGVAARAPSNRVNMQAMLRAEPAFSRVVRSSVVGYGDEEMVRDQHSILPLSLGGRVDWYVRTTERVTLKTLAKSATLLAVDQEGRGIWQVDLARDDAPGFYEVDSVRPAGAGAAGGFPIVGDTRSTDLSGLGFVPDVQTVAEGAYTRYQTSVVQFVDTSTDHSGLAAGASADYDVTVRVMDGIAAVQDFVSAFDVRSYGADVLVKAPVPCFVQVTFAVHKRSTDPDPDVDAIKASVAAEVNAADFTGRLFASRLQDAIHGHLPAGVSVGAVDMLGRVRWPDGTVKFVRGSEVLSIAAGGGTMVSPRTVQFFCDPGGVTVSIRTGVPVPA